VFPGPVTIGFVWSGVGQALMQFQQFWMFLLFRHFWWPYRPCGTHSKRCKWGCCDSICLLGYKRTFLASLQPCLGPVGAHVKDAKSPFLLMADMCGWAYTQPADAVSRSKVEVSEPYFLDIITTHNEAWLVLVAQFLQ